MAELSAYRARMSLCHECPHRITHHAKHAQWPFCIYDGYEARIEVSPQFLRGNEGQGCPAGLWKNLKPVEVTVDKEAAEEAKKEGVRKTLKPLLSAALATVAAKDRTLAWQAILKMVGERGLPVWLGQELASELAIV